jgi:shikimate kinase
MKGLKKIFLIGFMGSGKSTHARKLAAAIGYSYLDLDEYIQKKEGASVQQIFSEKGEGHFRTLEKKYLEEIVQQDHCAVVSLGGGTVCFNNNMEKVLESGLAVYLKMSAEALCSRLSNSRQERPMIAGKNKEELLSFIKTKLEERRVFYERAQVTVDGLNLNPSKLKEEVYLFSERH